MQMALATSSLASLFGKGPGHVDLCIMFIKYKNNMNNSDIAMQQEI